MEDAWQFSTTSFWSLSVQSFIALESRLLIPPPLFVHPSPSSTASARTLAEIQVNPFASVRQLRDIAWTLKIQQLLAINACSDVTAVSELKQLRWRGAFYVHCYLSLRSCFFRVALCVAELFREALLLFVLVCKSCSYVIYFLPYVCKRLQIVQMLGAACTVIYDASSGINERLRVGSLCKYIACVASVIFLVSLPH